MKPRRVTLIWRCSILCGDESHKIMKYDIYRECFPKHQYMYSNHNPKPLSHCLLESRTRNLMPLNSDGHPGRLPRQSLRYAGTTDAESIFQKNSHGSPVIACRTVDRCSLAWISPGGTNGVGLGPGNTSAPQKVFSCGSSVSVTFIMS
jgi:hypothetical protein